MYKWSIFYFDGKTYVQTKGVAMGSPLGSVLSGIFMVELENYLIHTLLKHLACWKKYVDDTICFIKNDSIDYVFSVLNSFHLSIHMKQKIITSSHSSTSNYYSLVKILKQEFSENLQILIYIFIESYSLRYNGIIVL